MGGSQKYNIVLLKHNYILEDAKNKISKYPELVKFAKNAPWMYADPSSVDNIRGDDDSFKKQLDSLTENINTFSDNHLLIFVRFQ